VSRGFSGFLTFQSFAGRKIFLPSVGRETRRQQLAGRRDEAGGAADRWMQSIAMTTLLSRGTGRAEDFLVS
jgi:hypothetical protein